MITLFLNMEASREAKEEAERAECKRKQKVVLEERRKQCMVVIEEEVPHERL